jgi:hypothetical protein
MRSGQKFPLWWRKIKFISAVVAENKIYFRRDARNAKNFRHVPFPPPQR